MSRESDRIDHVAKMFSDTRALPMAYARADVADILKAAGEWDAVQDAPSVRDLAELLNGHTVKPSGLCSCGVQVNSESVKGLARARSLNRHRAVVLHAAGYRWAPELEWQWAAVGPHEAARDVETYSWGPEADARSLYAVLVVQCMDISPKAGPVVLVRRTPAGGVEEVDRWEP